jgi:serine protease inhibitor
VSGRRPLTEATMHHKHRWCALFVAAILLGSTARSAAPQAPADVSAADNAFGFRLLTALQQANASKNVVLSPVSAALNLSMVLAGADGETRQEMLSALSLGGINPAAVDEANAILIKVMRTPAQSTTLSVADSLWVDNRHVRLRPEYIKQTRTSYDAEIVDLDFSDPGAATRINGWASKETQGKITKIIDEIDPHDRLLLLNAVYFKGQWAHKFDKSRTQQKDFKLASGSVKQVPRMVQSGRFEYFETPELQAIRLPFGDGDLVMDILLPTQSTSLDALEADLTPQHWKSWQAHYAPQPGAIELPRFELKADYHLNEALQSLGMRRAFKQDAQLTGLFTSESPQGGSGRFFISYVRQSTFWKVDEEGSEAAAVTAAGVRATALARPVEPFRMIVDRPFFCAIEDRRSGALLFIGAIYDPTA